jgi:hypothetical protein
MYELTKLIDIVLYSLLVCLVTAISFTLVLPHYAIHSGKTHFPINICDKTHYAFRFTPLVHSEVKPKVPSSLYAREFVEKVHKKHLYSGQSDVLQITCQRVFDGILSFAQVASMKGSKRGSNAVLMRV